MFVATGTPLRCNLADYAADFGNVSGRFVQTEANAFLWQGTLASQTMVGTTLVAIDLPHGTKYVLHGGLGLFQADTGLTFVLQGGLEATYRRFSEAKPPMLSPYYEGATKLVRYRELSFSSLVAYVAHQMYRLAYFGKPVTAAESLQRVLQDFRQVPELYNEDLLRQGMDACEAQLGFRPSYTIVVGATDKHSFDSVLLRAVEALAPKEIARLHAEAKA